MRRESICFGLTIAIGVFCLMVATVTTPVVAAVFQLDAVLTTAELQDSELRQRISAVLVKSNGRQSIFWGLVGMANIGVGAFGLRGRRKAEVRYSA